MNSKKIFFIADAKSIHTAKWVDYFVKKEYDVYLATFSSSNNTMCENVYFLSEITSSYKGGNYHYLFKVLKLGRLLKRIKPNYINAHYSYSNGLIALLAKLYSKIDAELSIVCHGSDILAPPNQYVFDKVNRYILKRADKVYAVSDQIKDKIEILGIDLNKVFVGQYGISASSLNKDKDIDILSNRAYLPNSRIDFLLESLDNLKYKNLKIVFVLPHVSNFKFDELVNKYPDIIFRKHIGYDEMLDLTRRAKIYVSATQSDGTSLSLLEAMYLGCVPIVSNIVSNRSWVLDGINGYLFDTKQEFLTKLNNVMSSVNDQQEIIQLNKKLLYEKGDHKRQMNKIEKFMI